MDSGILPPPSINGGGAILHSQFAGASLPPPPQYGSSVHHVNIGANLPLATSYALNSGDNQRNAVPRDGKMGRRNQGGAQQVENPMASQKRLRIDRTQQCPFTVRVRWGSRLDLPISGQTQALEVLSGVQKPDMGLVAWQDTQAGDLVSRILSFTRDPNHAKVFEKSGLAGFDGSPFALSLCFATNNNQDGSVQYRFAFRARIDEKGVPVRNPYYFQPLASLGYTIGHVVLVEASTFFDKSSSSNATATPSSGGAIVSPPGVLGAPHGSQCVLGIAPLPPLPPAYATNAPSNIAAAAQIGVVSIMPPPTTTPATSSEPLLPTPY